MATVFIGGSALLLAGAAVALVFGFGGGEESLVWTSLFAAGGAAVFLVIAYVLSRRELKRAKRASSAPITSSTAGRETDVAPEAVSAVDQDETKQAAASDETTDVAPAAAAADESRGVRTAESPGGAVSGDHVIAVPSRKKFHRPECRYAASEGEPMTASDARKKGYSACGICKP